MKVRFTCVRTLSGTHDVDVSLVDLILNYPPMCCNRAMVPVDPNKWQRIKNEVTTADECLISAGLPSLRVLLQQAQGR